MDEVTISEAARLVGVKPHVLRYWEQELVVLRPAKGLGNRRKYSRADIALLKSIYHLVYERKMTVKGAENELLKHPVVDDGGADLRRLKDQILAIGDHARTLGRLVDGAGAGLAHRLRPQSAPLQLVPPHSTGSVDLVADTLRFWQSWMRDAAARRSSRLPAAPAPAVRPPIAAGVPAGAPPIAAVGPSPAPAFIFAPAAGWAPVGFPYLAGRGVMPVSRRSTWQYWLEQCMGFGRSTGSIPDVFVVVPVFHAAEAAALLARVPLPDRFAQRVRLVVVPDPVDLPAPVSSLAQGLVVAHRLVAMGLIGGDQPVVTASVEQPAITLVDAALDAAISAAGGCRGGGPATGPALPTLAIKAVHQGRRRVAAGYCIGTGAFSGADAYSWYRGDGGTRSWVGIALNRADIRIRWCDVGVDEPLIRSWRSADQFLHAAERAFEIKFARWLAIEPGAALGALPVEVGAHYALNAAECRARVAGRPWYRIPGLVDGVL